MDEVLTLAEMEQQYQSEWILVEDPDTNEELEVIRGRVACHSPDRDEVYRAAVKRKPKRSAIVYTGEFPTGAAVVL